MADREVNRCNRICGINDPDKGCLLGGVESCRIGSEQVMHRIRCDFPIGQKIPIDALLIDANVVLTAIDKKFHKTDPSGEEQVGFLKCRRIVRTEQTVDAVEVVRCKDCEHGVFGSKNCVTYCRLHRINTVNERFCSEGKRRNADKSRDLSGYADKLREIKEEKAKKYVEKALEKVGKAGLI